MDDDRPVPPWPCRFWPGLVRQRSDRMPSAACLGYPGSVHFFPSNHIMADDCNCPLLDGYEFHCSQCYSLVHAYFVPCLLQPIQTLNIFLSCCVQHTAIHAASALHSSFHSAGRIVWRTLRHDCAGSTYRCFFLWLIHLRACLLQHHHLAIWFPFFACSCLRTKCHAKHFRFHVCLGRDMLLFSGYLRSITFRVAKFLLEYDTKCCCLRCYTRFLAPDSLHSSLSRYWVRFEMFRI